jgi:hypothetical protein
LAYFYEGILNTKNIPYQVRKLSAKDIGQVLALQDTVIDALDNKQILQPLAYEEFRYIAEGNGLMIGVFAEGKLIAFRALMIPPIDEEHLGLDIGLKKEELKDVIYQEISNVHPDYRGNGLQKKMAALIMEQLKEMGRSFQYVCCTVMPFNLPSLKDKFSQGMIIRALKEKYGGRLRYVFVKEIGAQREKEWSETRKLPMGDIKGQQDLLEQGWAGYKMEERDGEYWVLYGK